MLLCSRSRIQMAGSNYVKPTRQAHTFRSQTQKQLRSELSIARLTSTVLLSFIATITDKMIVIWSQTHKRKRLNKD